MFFRKIAPNHLYRFVAVLEIEDRTDDRHLYGQRTFRLKLADGTYEQMTFEAEDWRAWQESLRKGGIVINA
ncbi:MAG: hypothetical protein K2X12_02610 [Burkholderiaceae bacterium]|jgi:hypothetical protein|nr:hypothetical protein [Burkholderiaceae bacterium]